MSLLLRPWTTPYLDNPSKLACDHPGMEADWSPTARFNEHRHPENTIGLVCALGEQRRPTASPPLPSRVRTPGARERYGCRSSHV